MCKGKEGFRGEIDRGNSVVLLVMPDERQDEISNGKSQSALDSRLTDRSIARYLSCTYIGDPIYVRASAYAIRGRTKFSILSSCTQVKMS